MVPRVGVVLPVRVVRIGKYSEGSDSKICLWIGEQVKESNQKMQPDYFILRAGRMQLSFIQIGENEEKAREKHQEFGFEHGKFEAPVTHPKEYIKEAEKYGS